MLQLKISCMLLLFYAAIALGYDAESTQNSFIEPPPVDGDITDFFWKLFGIGKSKDEAVKKSMRSVVPKAAGCKSTLFSEHDIMTVIEYLFNRSDKDSLIKEYLANVHNLSDTRMRELDSFLKTFSDKPRHLSDILGKAAKDRQALEKQLPDLDALAQTYPGLHARFEQQQARFQELVRAGMRTKAMCIRNRCPAPPREFFTSSGRLPAEMMKMKMMNLRHKRDISDSNRYCIPINELYAEVTHLIANFNKEVSEEGNNILHSDAKNFEQKIENLKESLKKKAIDAFGEIMYDVLHLQDELIHIEYTIEDALRSIEKNGLKLIGENLVELENLLGQMEFVLRKLTRYCKTCRRKNNLLKEDLEDYYKYHHNREQKHEFDENYHYNSEEGHAADDNYLYNSEEGHDADENYHYNSEEGLAADDNYHYHSEEGHAADDNYHYSDEKHYPAEETLIPAEDSNANEINFSFFNLTFNLFFKTSPTDRAFMKLEDASQSTLLKLVQEFYRKQLVELEKEYIAVFAELDRKILTAADLYVEDMEPIQRGALAFIRAEGGELRRLAAAVPSLHDLEQLAQAVDALMQNATSLLHNDEDI